MTRAALMLLAACALALPLAACGGDGDDGDRAASPLQTGGTIREDVDGDGVTVPLEEQDGSGIGGEATFLPARDQTRVVIRVDAPTEEPLDAAIRETTCAELDASAAAAYELEPAGVEEQSESVVDTALQTLLDGDYALVLVRGGDVVACADVAGPPE